MTRAYVGTYAAAEEPGIYALEFDESSGTFEIVGAFSGVENPSYLAVRNDLLLAVGETGKGTGSVHAFRLTGWPPHLELLGAGATNGDYPCHLSIDATGRWMAAANYGTGNVVVLPVTAGDLGEVSSEVQHGGSGPNESRQEGPHAHCALFSPSNRFVVAADLGIDRILVYGFDEVDGRLTYQTGVATLPGAGPRHVAFHPTVPVMFGVNELDNALVAYDFDRDTGELRVRQAVSTVPPEVGESTAAGIQISASGRHLYVSNRGNDSIAVFSFADGTLARTAVRSCGGVWPRSIALTPGHLLVANRRSNEVVVLPLTENGSDLGDPVARVTIEEPAHVIIG